MTAPSYPSSLPGPSGYSMSPNGQLAGAGDEPFGPIALRRRSRQPVAQAPLRFVYLEDDYKIFLNWWRTELLYGLRKFTLRIPCAGGMAVHVVRITDKFQSTKQGFRHVEVTVPIEIRERLFEPDDAEPEPPIPPDPGPYSGPFWGTLPYGAIEI